LCGDLFFVPRRRAERRPKRWQLLEQLAQQVVLLLVAQIDVSGREVGVRATYGFGALAVLGELHQRIVESELGE
jgi:hypothetical protein